MDGQTTELHSIDSFEVPLYDLGETDPGLSGILRPVPEVGTERIGITKQFLEDAESYHQRYSNSTHFESLFQKAFTAAGVLPDKGLQVLDIGTGSGTNTIIPCLTLFPDCQIVATDLSPDLLRILRVYLDRCRLDARVTCVCTDAMNNYFRPDSFDVVVGAAILHHLLDPTRALAAAHRALRPGGVAFFFEPFEGVAILRVAYDLILERAVREPQPLEPAAARLLAAMSADYAARAGSDKSAPHFKLMDDKWVFTRDWLERAAREVGFAPPVVVPHAFHATLFHDYTAGLLRLGASLEPEHLADWAWQLIDVFDRSFSADMKRDLLLEGTIVLRKPLCAADRGALT